MRHINGQTLNGLLLIFKASFFFYIKNVLLFILISYNSNNLYNTILFTQYIYKSKNDSKQTLNFSKIIFSK